MDARITTVDVLGARPQPRGGDQGPGTSSVDGALSEGLLHEAEVDTADLQQAWEK